MQVKAEDIVKSFHWSIIGISTVILIFQTAIILENLSANLENSLKILSIAVSIIGVSIASIGTFIAAKALTTWKKQLTNTDRYNFELEIRSNASKLKSKINKHAILINGEVIRQLNHPNRDLKAAKSALKERASFKEKNNITNDDLLNFAIDLTIIKDSQLRARQHLVDLSIRIEEDLYKYTSGSTLLFEAAFYGDMNYLHNITTEEYSYNGNLHKKITSQLDLLDKAISSEWKID